jgi:hypothetical protein
MFRKLYYQETRNLIFTGANTFALGKQFDLKPQFLFATDLDFATYTANLTGTFCKKYWLGISYGTGETGAIMAGWDIREKFRVGYLYEQNLHTFSGSSQGTHEVVLGSDPIRGFSKSTQINDARIIESLNS